MRNKSNEEEERIFHELSQKYGQTMTMADVCAEMQYKQSRTVRKFIQRGWFGAAPSGLRIRTAAFANQLAALQEGNWV